MGERGARGFPGAEPCGPGLRRCRGGGAATASMAPALPVRAPPLPPRPVSPPPYVTAGRGGAFAYPSPRAGHSAVTRAGGAGCPMSPSRPAAPGAAPSSRSPLAPPAAAPREPRAGWRWVPSLARTAPRPRAPPSAPTALILNGRVIPAPSLPRGFQQPCAMQARKFSQRKVPICLFIYLFPRAPTAREGEGGIPHSVSWALLKAGQRLPVPSLL